MYVCVCVCGGGGCFADFIFFLKYTMKMKPLRPNYFIFVGCLKTGRRGGGGGKRTPGTSPGSNHISFEYGSGVHVC